MFYYSKNKLISGRFFNSEIFANRRLKLYNSNAVCLVTGLLTPLATDHVTFFVLRFLQGLACNSFWSIPYILGEEDRQQTTVLFQPFRGG